MLVKFIIISNVLSWQCSFINMYKADLIYYFYSICTAYFPVKEIISFRNSKGKLIEKTWQNINIFRRDNILYTIRITQK